MKNIGPVLLLAGGKSSRMGQPKGLVPHEGRPWVEHQINRLVRAGLKEIILVLGYQEDAYRAALSWIAASFDPEGIEWESATVRSVSNPNPAFGPFTSILAGARHAIRNDPMADDFWVLPIDVPCAGREVWERLSSCTDAAACIPTHLGQGGHPVRLSRPFVEHLMTVAPDAPDARLDLQLQSIGSRAERLEVADARILKNMNSPSDWGAAGPANSGDDALVDRKNR